MIDSLYDKFKEWSVGGSIYIISDPHFEDEDCKLMDKNWITPQEHVERINAEVHKADTLIILGDIGNEDWVRRLKAGRKILVTGNHDKGVSVYKRKTNDYACTTNSLEVCENIKKEVERKRKKGYVINLEVKKISNYYIKYHEDNRLFDEVYDGPLFISDRILLSHEPIDGLEKFCVNIHGHDHAGCYRPNHVCLAANVVDYSVFNLGKFIKEGGLSKVENYHRFTIDTATKRKGKR